MEFLQFLFTILLKTFKRATELMSRYLYLITFSTSDTLLMADAYQRHFTCTCILLIFVTTPAHSLGGQQCLLYRYLIDTRFRFYQFYFRIVLFYETDDLWRIYRSKIHVSLKLYACQLSDMIEGLRVFSSAERKIIPPPPIIVSKRQSFGFLQQIDAILHLTSQSFAGTCIRFVYC